MIEAVMMSLDALSVILQIGAIYFAYRLTRMTGEFRAWWLIIVGITLMTGRRLADIGMTLEKTSLATSVDFINAALGFVISAAIVTGMYELNRAFARSERPG
jgi:uncharacterized membrane protein